MTIETKYNIGDKVWLETYSGDVYCIAIIVLLAIGLCFSVFVIWVGIKHAQLGGISTIPPDRPRIIKPKRK